MTPATPFHFGPPPRRLFGLFHPAQGTPRGGVLLCPPLLHEHARSYRFFAAVADQFAAQGVACLRFDYHGTGDSPGDSEAFDPRRALDDIAAAAAELHARLPGLPWALLGVRASALLARAAAVRLSPSALWLWQPVRDARAWLDELDTLDAAERASSLRYPFSLRGPAREPGEIAGFGLSPDFGDALQAIAHGDAAPGMPTMHVDAAEAPPLHGAAARIALPPAATGWVGQVELEGLVPPRAARDAVAALVPRLADGG